MTNGTSQGLFVIVAVVIFGIFVAISYSIFRGSLQPALANIFKDSLTQAEEKLSMGSTTENEIVWKFTYYRDRNLAKHSTLHNEFNSRYGIKYRYFSDIGGLFVTPIPLDGGDLELDISYRDMGTRPYIASAEDFESVLKDIENTGLQFLNNLPSDVRQGISKDIYQVLWEENKSDTLKSFKIDGKEVPVDYTISQTRKGFHYSAKNETNTYEGTQEVNYTKVVVDRKENSEKGNTNSLTGGAEVLLEAETAVITIFTEPVNIEIETSSGKKTQIKVNPQMIYTLERVSLK